MASNDVWTEERIEILKDRWLVKGLSTSQIAAELGSGITKNAVIGKIHRLGIVKRDAVANSRAPRVKTARASQPRIPREKKAQVKVAVRALDRAFSQQRAALPLAPFVLPEAAAFGVEAIMLLKEDTCRWPVGDPGAAEFRFCGASSGSASSYCPHHHQLAYQPASPRVRSRPFEMRRMAG